MDAVVYDDLIEALEVDKTEDVKWLRKKIIDHIGLWEYKELHVPKYQVHNAYIG